MIQTIKKHKIRIYTGLGLLVLTILALIPCIPLTGVLNRDSGVFLYIAKQILAGEIPYREIWDHKGPMIYYIDALGLLIAGGSRWGVWLIELLSLYSAAVLGYVVMTRSFGRQAAVLASIIWLTSSSFLLRLGNWTEEFSLPLSFAALFLFWYSETYKRYHWSYFMIGVTLAISFLLRANNIGLHISILLLSLIYFFRISRQSLLPEIRESLIKILLLSAGCFLTLFFVSLFFVFNHSFSDFLDQVFYYNYIYSSQSQDNRLDSLRSGILLMDGLSLISFISWILLFYARFRATLFTQNTKLLDLVLIGFPIEVLMSSISGKSLDHYYINWLPVCSILVAIFVFLILNHPSLIQRTQNNPSSDNTGVLPEELDTKLFRMKHLNEKKKSKLVWLLALFFMINIYPIKKTALKFHSYIQDKEGMNSIITEYVLSQTNEDDYLLMWGAETQINFLSNRKSPTRFVYQYPLYTRHYHSEEMVELFLNDIISKKPIIIDSSPTNSKIPPIDDHERKKWDDENRSENWGSLAEMAKVFDFIHQHYKIVDRIGPDQWTVYVYVEDQEQKR